MDEPITSPAAATAAPLEPPGGAPHSAGPRVLRPLFTGTAGEYFRIWVVNLFFSLVTLGIYSAWAKVRKKKYFYGSTTLDGDSFDYLASPRAILKGRLIAAAVFIIYGFASQLYPGSQAVFIILGVFVLPWLIARARAFNARNSAWRGLRFDFTAGPKAAFKFYLPRWLGLVFSFGLAFPWYAARQREFTVSSHAYGSSRFECRLSVKTYYGIYFRGGLIVTAGGAVVGFGVGFLGGSHLVPDSGIWALILPLLVGYGGYGFAYAYIQARIGNLAWANTVAPGMRFESTLKAWDLVKLYLVNVIAAAASAGLLIPWGVIRVLRYRLEHFSVIIEEEVVHEASPALARIDATGQELGDFFNVDFGL